MRAPAINPSVCPPPATPIPERPVTPIVPPVGTPVGYIPITDASGMVTWIDPFSLWQDAFYQPI